VLLLMAPGISVRAQEDDELLEVASLTIEGAMAIEESTLKDQLATRAGSGLPWSEPRYFDRDRFDADLQRLEAYYADRGYPDARIRTFRVDLSEDQRSVAIAIVVDEGMPDVLRSVRVDGLDVLPAGSRDRLEGELRATVGQPFDRPALDAWRVTVQRELGDHGYPRAEVSVSTDEPAEHEIAVGVDVAPGPPSAVGDIVIEGNASVSDTVVRRSLDFREGDRFSLSAIGRSQRRLYDLDLFQFVNVETRLEEARGDAIPVRVTLAEQKHRRLEFRVGYGSEERLRGEASWRHVNFFGGARTAGIEGKWSALDRGARATFTQPYVLGPAVSLALSGERWFADEPAYELDTVGGRIALTYERASRGQAGDFSTTTTLTGSVVFEKQEFAIVTEALADLSFRDELIALGLDPRTGVGRGQLMSVALDFRRSTTSDLLDSQQGYVLIGHLEQAGWWLPGNYRYAEVRAEGRYYRTIAGWAVVAVRARAGTLATDGELATNVPFFKRYFLGGSSSLRGWGRFEVSPLSAAGLSLGGHSLLEMSTEIRVPVTGSLNAVAFVDAGNVWSESWRFELSSLRYDAGPGLRYMTPIGPIRADLAFQLAPIDRLLVDGEPETRHWRLHVSIGQAF